MQDKENSQMHAPSNVSEIKIDADINCPIDDAQVKRSFNIDKNI